MVINNAWNLTDLESVPKNGLKTMTTFACGGGSSMGYKRAGYEIVAANDIDPIMEWHYKLNLKPKNFLMCPVKELIDAELPEELFNLDILDGSPPCSSFSMAGKRKKDWGKEKFFREGQAAQVLDDLFFDFIAVANHLRPKVVIAENVKGMLAGQAKGYLVAITKQLRAAGYKPQTFLVNAASFGVPQKRERVFIIAVREDLKVQPLVLPEPQGELITVQAAFEGLPKIEPEEIATYKLTQSQEEAWLRTLPGDNFVKARQKMHAVALSGFTDYVINPNRPAPTVSAHCKMLHWKEKRHLSFGEIKRLQTFPDDYQAKNWGIGKYIVGMSVPPLMMEMVARAVAEQWLGAKELAKV